MDGKRQTRSQHKAPKINCATSTEQPTTPLVVQQQHHTTCDKYTANHTNNHVGNQLMQAQWLSTYLIATHSPLPFVALEQWRAAVCRYVCAVRPSLSSLCSAVSAERCRAHGPSSGEWGRSEVRLSAHSRSPQPTPAPLTAAARVTESGAAAAPQLHSAAQQSTGQSPQCRESELGSESQRGKWAAEHSPPAQSDAQILGGGMEEQASWRSGLMGWLIGRGWPGALHLPTAQLPRLLAASCCAHLAALTARHCARALPHSTCAVSDSG